MMVTQKIRLGPQETSLLFTLEERGFSVFTMDDAKGIWDRGTLQAGW